MKLTFLGTGTSCGAPVLGCDCEVCRSKDPRDQRLRCSALVETDATRILIDCGPDFRQQMLRQPFRKIDGVLLTHIHYDHVGGLDDLRPFCKLGEIDIYSEEDVAQGVMRAMPYCFKENKYPGVPIINLHTIEPHQQFTVGDISVTPLRVMHGALPILGFRFDKFAYITDMKTMPDSEMAHLGGLELLVVNALRFTKPHHSHQLVDECVEFVNKIRPNKTLIIHTCHDIGLHDAACSRLPEGIDLAYDGQVVNL